MDPATLIGLIAGMITSSNQLLTALIGKLDAAVLNTVVTNIDRRNQDYHDIIMKAVRDLQALGDAIKGIDRPSH